MKYLGEEHDDEILDTQHYLYEIVEEFFTAHNVTDSDVFHTLNLQNPKIIEAFLKNIGKTVGYVRYTKSLVESVDELALADNLTDQQRELILKLKGRIF